MFEFDNSFARELPALYVKWQSTEVPDASLIVSNKRLALEMGLGLNPYESEELVSVLAGSAIPEGSAPIAMAYAGHQFGGYSPRLGDGRALLLGEILDIHGNRRDIHLKGSGRTPFARGGDGKAALGPMLREFLMSEAMDALGIPTTQALAVVATGERINREGLAPGAVLTRVAASHIRVGTFEYAARLSQEAVRDLADYTINRHYPDLVDSSDGYLGFLEAVVESQAILLAQWMQVGFVHGVLNTDNVTISGEGIDYGPCAFMDRYDPATVFSSIDTNGRYAYGNQPGITHWNLARLAESLLPLIGPDSDEAVKAATQKLMTFPDRYQYHWTVGMAVKLGMGAKLGIGDDKGPEATGELADDLLALMQSQRIDYTSCFRALAQYLRGDELPLRSLFIEFAQLEPWLDIWTSTLGEPGEDLTEVATSMDLANPVYVPRNHLVEHALTAATNGDLGPFDELLEAVRQPFDERAGFELFAEPAPDEFTETYQTFCGT